MYIERIGNYELEKVIQLVKDVFMKFEAPDYTDEGIKAFFDTAVNNEDFMKKLTIYAAYMDVRWFV